MRVFSGLKIASVVSCLSLSGVLAMSTAAVAASPGEAALQNRTIAYTTYWNQWAIYQTPSGKEECPDGLYGWGPRERIKALYPKDGAKPLAKDTRLALEGALWNPAPTNAQVYNFPFPEAGGPKSFGMNLDGKVGPEDFTSPDGEKGIDNQLYRVIGCSESLRGPDGVYYTVGQLRFRGATFNRIVLEITNVDDLTNDPDVDVLLTRSLDDLITDAGGDRPLPGGTQRLDTRFTKNFDLRLKGKIVDGTLITAPVPVLTIPDIRVNMPVVELFRDGQFKLRLTPDFAEGLIAGYLDVDRFYFNFNRSFTANEAANGRDDPLAQYVRMLKFADAYPDPKTGKNTAISAAQEVRFVQTFLVRPNKAVASIEGGVRGGAASKAGER